MNGDRVRYIVGMNRDRDKFQVPAALAEVGMLSELVTDYYWGRSLIRLPSLRHRRSPYIDPGSVSVANWAFGLQVGHRAASKLLRRSLPFPSRRVDDQIADALVHSAGRNPDAGFFVYSNYAYKAFEKFTDRRRVLFQYHPSTSAIAAGLATDETAMAKALWESEPEISDGRRLGIYNREIASSDLIVCASAFTARGLVNDGVSPGRVVVVPYGCEVPDDVDTRSPRKRQVLFVGQGIQRKGLHLLVDAWREIRPSGWTLRVVASRLDPAMASRFSDAADDGIEISGPVDSATLRRLYAESDTFILPSLVEGFGLVIGEALGYGCRVIATTNTGLPDLVLSPSVATVIRPGEVGEIRDALQFAFDTYAPEAVYREEAREAALARSWGRFRSDIRLALDMAS